MGFFKFLSGKSPEDIEQQGDGLYDKGAFGPAKIEYEKALTKFEKKPPGQTDFKRRITGKIIRTKEGLARQHLKNAEELLTSDCFEESREFLDLAIELTADDTLKSQVSGLMERLSSRLLEFAAQNDMGEAGAYFDDDSHEIRPEWDDEGQGEVLEDEEEYFNALISVLPPDEQDAYATYGRSFVTGYIALNQGGFDVAAEKLAVAISENVHGKTYIPLELATCCLNLEEYEKAKDLLHGFLIDFPHCMRAYHVLCETLWAQENFQEALRLLSHCPEEIRHTPEIHFLTGETLVQAEKFREAEAYYLDYIASNGRDDPVIRALAGVYEALGETAKAKALYGELLNACTGCGRRADVHLKSRFADTSFALGDRSLKTLEMYLELAGEDPFNRGRYYENVAEIYNALGNQTEAMRFLRFAEKERQRVEA